MNYKYKLGREKSDLLELLNIATKKQLFQFEGNLYEQTDGVAMGSPLGPLMANAFMCSTEVLQRVYKPRFVDDALSMMLTPKQLKHFFALSNGSQMDIHADTSI